MTQTKPNILFVMADQLAAQFLPFYGHQLVKTPNLSRLAAEGVVFENPLFHQSAVFPCPRYGDERPAALPHWRL